MKTFPNTILTLLFTIFFGCTPEKTTESINSDPVIPNVSSIDDPNKIEIVTWNIQNFPKNSYTNDYVKAIIEGLGADVFILQEIQSRTSFATMLNEIADFDYFIQATSTTLNLAIIYKRDIVAIKSSTELFKDDPYFFAGRPPLLTKLEWQNNGFTKELTIINLHLKCCGDNSIEIGNNDDEEYRRVVACQLLHNYVSDSLYNQNVIIGGDWNDAIQEPESTNIFQIFIDDSTNFKFADMNIANGDATNWSWQGWSSTYPAIHFDHILINNNLFDELENSAVIGVIKVEEYFENGSSEYDGNVSDHRPVYFKFSP